MVRRIRSAWAHIWPSKTRLLQSPIEKVPIEIQAAAQRMVGKNSSGGKKKVYIAIPSFGDPPVETWETYLAFAYELGRRNQEYDFFLKVIYRKEQFRARNNLITNAMVNNMDYILFLDSDMYVRPDIFAKLVAHDKPITGCLYWQRGGAYEPVLMKENTKSDGSLTYDYIRDFPRGLIEVDAIGGGCMLIKMEVLDRLPQPWFWIDGLLGTDLQLCRNAKKLGFKVYCDTSIEIGHVGDRVVITERTIPMGLLALSRERARLTEDLISAYSLTPEQLDHMMLTAMESRGGVGEIKEGCTFKEYVDAYNLGGDMMAFNLAGWNMNYNSTEDYVMSFFRFKLTDKILDYGSGTGFLSLPLAERGHSVTALDIPTQAQVFLKRRADKRSIYMRHVTLTDWLWNTNEKFNVILMVSVINHLPNALDALRWCKDHLEDGGFLIMDSYQDQSKIKEKQHLCTFNPHTIGLELRNMGLVQSDESPYLFRKEQINGMGKMQQEADVRDEEKLRRPEIQGLQAG